MPSSFVNPLPDLSISKYFLFDFPADYRAKGALPNINIEPPAVEEIYGRLGTPPKEQGHPCFRELPPEAEDPKGPLNKYHDQIVDIGNQVRIDHTARLSGTFVRYLACGNFKSRVRMSAHPLTSNGGVVELRPPITSALTPGTNAPNGWFWVDAEARNELLFTAQATFLPEQVGLRAGNLYKLIVRWEFWDYNTSPAERMPISGFDEALAFEVSEPTSDL